MRRPKATREREATGDHESVYARRKRTRDQRGLLRGWQGQRATTTTPPLTPDSARDFAKLLAAGVSASEAIRFVHPSLYATATPAQRRRWASVWTNDALLLDAINLLRGGAWQDLDKDARLSVALDKHLAELAYFLYTHDYAKLEGDALRKADAAAERLMEYLAESDGAPSTAWQAFVQALMDKVDRASDESTVNTGGLTVSENENFPIEATVPLRPKH